MSHEMGGSGACPNSAASDRKVAAVPQSGPVVLQSRPLSGGDRPRPRRPPPTPIPLLAALLSALVPGLGQLYVGRRRLGAVALATTACLLLVAMVASRLGTDQPDAAAAAAVSPCGAARTRCRLDAPPPWLRGRRVPQRAAAARASARRPLRRAPGRPGRDRRCDGRPARRRRLLRHPGAPAAELDRRGADELGDGVAAAGPCQRPAARRRRRARTGWPADRHDDRGQRPTVHRRGRAVRAAPQPHPRPDARPGGRRLRLPLLPEAPQRAVRVGARPSRAVPR
jgi:hypothetical protein